MKHLHSRAKKLLSNKKTARIAGALVVLALVFSFAHISQSITPHYAEVGFSSLSPSGAAGGSIIPASCSSGTFDATDQVACSRSNTCGQTNSGTVVDCSGDCSVNAPANPAGYGTVCNSPDNICGEHNTGTIQCNSACSATTPSNNCGGPATLYCQGTQTTCPVIIGHPVVLTWSCPSPNTSASANFAMNGAASGSATVTVNGSTIYTVQCDQTGKQASVTINGINPALTLGASPSRVNSGSSSTLTWSASQVTSCTLTGPGTSASATADGGGNISSRSTTTAPITGQSTFTLTCQTGGGPISTSVTITLVPNVIEI